MAAHRQTKSPFLPALMKQQSRWIRHEAKRPISLHGFAISITDESKWATLEDAVKSNKGDGIGFVLNGDGIVCIDLDDCMDNGQPSPSAQALIDSLPKTFIEVSPSGNGLHIWGLGNVDAGRRLVRDGLKMEVYGDKRYLTVSGKTHTKAPLAKLQLEGLID